MITLAAQAALSANRQGSTLCGRCPRQLYRAPLCALCAARLVGAAVGALVAMVAIAALPATDAAGGILMGLGCGMACSDGDLTVDGW